MNTYQDLRGSRYGMLVVESLMPSERQGKRRWICLCDCGKYHSAVTSDLTSGRVTSCGCRKSPDLAGQVFGRLTVIRRSEQRAPRGARTCPLWECQCECGNITLKATDTLRNPSESMCPECKAKINVQKAREAGGYADGTQITKIININAESSNATGHRGVYYDKRSNKYRARLKFKGSIVNLGSYEKLEDAITARKDAEDVYFAPYLESAR